MRNASLARLKEPAEPEADASLLHAAPRDPAAFGALYRRYVTPVYRYLYSRVGNSADAEDLTAQVFTAVLEGLPRYEEQGSFATWLFAIARHKAADHYRRNRQHLPLDEALDAPARDVDPLMQIVRDEALQRLGTLVTQLDEAQRELLRLRFAAGLGYAEIGTLVGRSEGAVKMAIHRLVRHLGAKWREGDA